MWVWEIRKPKKAKKWCFSKQKWLRTKHNLNDLNKSTLTWRCTIAWPFSQSMIFLSLCCRFIYISSILLFLSLLLFEQFERAASAILLSCEFVYHCYDFAFECITLTLLFAAYYVQEFYSIQLNILRYHYLNALFLSLHFHLVFFYNSLNKYLNNNKGWNEAVVKIV